MIDQARRQKLAFHLRHLAAGLISNDEFEGAVTEAVSFGWLPEQYYRAKEAGSDDPVIRPMLELSWCLYSDLEEHKLSGAFALTDGQLADIRRCILFLHSDIEYTWPDHLIVHPLVRLSFKELLLSALTFGQYYRNKVREHKQQLEVFKHAGDYDYWPFISKTQYEQQLQHPPFLAGRSQQQTS